MVLKYASIHTPMYNFKMYKAVQLVHTYACHLIMTTRCLPNNIVSSCALCVQGQECSNFLAGHALRSSKRFAALEETDIMGVVCRHEYPLCFINSWRKVMFTYNHVIYKLI